VSGRGLLQTPHGVIRTRRVRALAFLAIVWFLFAEEVPAGVGRWTSIGPEAAAVLSLAVDPTNPDVVYAGAYGRVFRSVNGGKTWFDESFGLPALVTVLRIDPENPETLYAGSHQGLFGSIDGGTHWTQIESERIGGPEVADVAIDPNRALFVVTGNGLYKSSNGGMDWVRLNAVGSRGYPVGPVSIELDQFDTSRIYIGTGSDGVLLSLDGGSTWTPVNQGLPSVYAGGTFVPILRLAHHPHVSGRLYAYTECGLGLPDIECRRLYKTVDGGASWFLASQIPHDALPGNPQVVNALEADSANNIYLATGDGVYVSPDGGHEWISIGPADLTGPVTSLTLDLSHPGTIYLGAASSVFKTTDAGGHWAASNSGLSNLPVQDLAIEPDNPQTLYAAFNGLFKGTGRGNSWSVVDAGQVFAVAVDPREPSRVYAAGVGFHASIDRGETWSHTDPGAVSTSVAVDPFDSETLYLGTCCLPRGHSLGVVKSTDRGRTWTVKSMGLPERIFIEQVVPDPRTRGTLYAWGIPGASVFRSTDGGETWLPLASEVPDILNTLAIAPDTPGKIYAGTRSGLFRSDDGGATWRSANSGLSDRHVLSIAIDPSEPERLYVGTAAAAVFRSTDAGDTWQPFDKGLRDRCVSSLAVDSTGRNLYAGTCSTSVFHREIRATRVVSFR
jgi:photosystem II stability/assembly factor-like uncharacterized protein